MTLVVRQSLRFVRDLFSYGYRSGRWWIAVMIPLLAAAAIAVAVAKAAVPTIVYAFF